MREARNGAGPTARDPETGRLGGILLRLRTRATQAPNRWVGVRARGGLVLAWRAQGGHELTITRPRSVVFEGELNAVVRAVGEHLGLRPSARRVLGHSIHLTLTDSG